MGVFSVVPMKGLDHVQTAFKGKDNPIEVILKEDCKEYDYSTAKVIRVKIGDVIIDSDTEPDAFYREEAQLGKLKIFIGDQNIPPKSYMVKIELTDAEDKVYYFGGTQVKIIDPGM